MERALGNGFFESNKGLCREPRGGSPQYSGYDVLKYPWGDIISLKLDLIGGVVNGHYDFVR